MIATHNQQTPRDSDSTVIATHEQIGADHQFSKAPSTLLPAHMIIHNPKAGLNPLADAASYLFTVISNLKSIKCHQYLSKLQKELIGEINSFLETVKNLGYNAEYLMVCRYIICATLEDIITNTSWGSQGRWDSYNLLTYFSQDSQHQDRFYNILERALKEPALYIDLMEFMYLCLSLGYKGNYRATVHSQYQLEQITCNLYKHIKAYRGNFSKTLSPPSHVIKSITKIEQKVYPFLISMFFLTTCTIMSIFVSLGYLMDVISDEAYKNVSEIKAPITHRINQ